MTEHTRLIASIREKIETLDSLNRELLCVRPQLDGVAGAAACDVAIGDGANMRQALDQIEHELEVDDGLYLDE